MLDLSEFNETQLQAVNWEKTGNLLVLSSSGAGNSRALVYRIARHSLEHSYEHLPFLGLTFSSKASSSVIMDIDNLLRDTKFEYRAIDSKKLTFRTYYEYAERMLRQIAPHFNRSARFVILKHERDKLLFLNQAIEAEFPRHLDLKAENLLPLINQLTENDVAPEKAAEYLDARSYANLEIPVRIYQRYRDMMPKCNVYDVPSMISDVIKFLEVQPAYLFIPRGFPFFCVDELHNITYVQYKFLRALYQPDRHNMFMMADDKKVFENWDGECISRLEAAQRDFGMKICRFPDNQQCADEIGRAGNKLTVCNFKDSEAAGPVGTFEWKEAISAISFKQFAEFSDEADWIAASIAKLAAKSRSKCAVMAVNTNLLKLIVGSLDKHGVNAYLPYGNGNFDSSHMNWYVAVLKLAASRIDRCCLQQVCMYFDTLCGITLNYKDIIAYAKAEGLDYLRSWADAVLNREETDTGTRSMIADSLLPDLLEKNNFRRFQKSAFKWLDGLNISAADPVQISENFAAEKVRWEELVKEISDQNEGRTTTLDTLIREFKNMLIPVPVPKGAVTCLKTNELFGSGFEQVYIAGLTEGQSPRWESIARGDSSREMKEDRRNFVAAITSAGKFLSLTCSSQMYGHQTKPSRFLDEMGMFDNDSSEIHEAEYEPEHEERLVAAE